MSCPPGSGVFLMWYLSKLFLGDIPRYPFLIRAISDAPSTKFGTLEIIAILLPPPMRPKPPASFKGLNFYLYRVIGSLFNGNTPEDDGQPSGHGTDSLLGYSHFT